MTKFVDLCTGVYGAGQYECGMCDDRETKPGSCCCGRACPDPATATPPPGTQTHKLKMASRLSRLAGDGQAYRAKSEQKSQFYPFILPNQTIEHNKNYPLTSVILLCSSNW